MGVATPALIAWNRGIISPLALARVDLDRIRLSAEIQTNWMPRALGSMMLRPGLKYLGTVPGRAYFLPFIFATNDVAKIELTNMQMRFWVNDAILTRPFVTTAITNGGFDSDISGWTDNDEAGGTSSWNANGHLQLVGNGAAAAISDQQVTVSTSYQNIVHGLRIIVQRGPVVCRVGSTLGNDDYVAETVLETGRHSIAFTPAGNFFVRFLNRLKRQVLVNSIAVEEQGPVSLLTPWPEADLAKIRFDQSASVVFVACDGYQQRRIERRPNNSWSVVTYLPEDGPFRLENVSTTTITPLALSGNTTLTSSAPIFKSTHAGALFRLTSSGQQVTAPVTTENQFTGAIRVTGVGTTRVFTYAIGGTWTATVTLQRSFTSDSGPWEDVLQRTANEITAHDDELTNLVVWYRIGVKTGDYTSGTINLTLFYQAGSIDGICRITGYTDANNVGAEVLKDFGRTTATDVWAEGAWSDFRGWPSAVRFVEGRLVWAGKNGIWMSVSDAYHSFDELIEGDSGPISRSIGSGPLDTVNWLLALQRLILGAQGAEHSIRSSSLDEPLTPSEFVRRAPSTQGSAAIDALQIDATGVFVQKCGSRLFELVFDSSVNDYLSKDVTVHAPEVCQPGVVRLAVQRQPDTRIHCVLSNGNVVVLLRDTAEEVLCWVKVETDGDVEDAIVLPGNIEDAVYYVVNRGGARHLMRWAREDQCQYGTTVYEGEAASLITDLPYADGTVVTVRNQDGSKLQNRTVTAGRITLNMPKTYVAITPAVYHLADAYVHYSGVARNFIEGLGHLEGETVVCFADGKDRGEFTVVSGRITLPEAIEEGIAGLPYRARYKSTKLAYGGQIGTALGQRKAISKLGLIMRDVHASGIWSGPDFSHLDPLPKMVDGREVEPHFIHPDYDHDLVAFGKRWGVDSRLCLEARAPRPCTLLAAILAVETHERT